MTNEEKLKKIIEKAVENGWNKDIKELTAENVCIVLDMDGNNPYFIRGLLFSHSFAKAFFGDGEHIKYIDMVDAFDDSIRQIEHKQIAYEYHLQQAVLSEDPIDYYYKNIKIK